MLAKLLGLSGPDQVITMSPDIDEKGTLVRPHRVVGITTSNGLVSLRIWYTRDKH